MQVQGGSAAGPLPGSAVTIAAGAAVASNDNASGAEAPIPQETSSGTSSSSAPRFLPSLRSSLPIAPLLFATIHHLLLPLPLQCSLLSLSQCLKQRLSSWSPSMTMELEGAFAADARWKIEESLQHS